MKIANAPKKQAPPRQVQGGQRYIPTFDIESQMGGGSSGYQSKPQYGGTSKISQSRPTNNKKPMGNMGYGNYGGGFGGGFGGSMGMGGGNYEAMNPSEDEPTYPCPDCGRSFTAQALKKHQKICKKVFQKKRKAFDMTKKRMVDSEQMSLMKQGEYQAKRNPKLNKKNMGGVPAWKKQSEEFRRILKANRGLSFNNVGNSYGGGSKYGMLQGGKYGSSISKGGMSKGGMGMGMGSYTPSAIADGYTLCKFCNRRYNEEAYNKHLPGCERRFKEAEMRNKITRKPVGKTGGNKYGRK